MSEPRFKTLLTDEDLKAAGAGRPKFQDKAWYKMRCIATVAAVPKPAVYMPGTPEEKWPSGNRMIVEQWVALRPDGSLSTRTPEVTNYVTLYSRPIPGLLKEKGYTDEMIAKAAEGGVPQVYDALKARFAAHDPGQFQSRKGPDGKWNMSIEELRNKVIEFQDYLYEHPEEFKSDEVFWRVSVEKRGGFTNYRLQYPKHHSDPPKKQGGGLEIVLDPDA